MINLNNLKKVLELLEKHTEEIEWYYQDDGTVFIAFIAKLNAIELLSFTCTLNTNVIGTEFQNSTLEKEITGIEHVKDTENAFMFKLSVGNEYEVTTQLSAFITNHNAKYKRIYDVLEKKQEE